MSKYTMELRELFTPIKFNPPFYTRSEVESFFKDYELSNYLTSDQIDKIEEVGIWSKDRLATKIVNHYYMREIGQETIGLWKHYVKVTMDEVMEEFLPLIYAKSIELNPLIEYKEIFSRTASVDNTGESSSNSTNSGNSIGISSDTPQGRISKTNILSGDYATATSGTETETSIENETTTSSGSDSTEEYTRSKINYEMIEKYKNNIASIDNQIIEKLEPLFMGLY